MTTPTTGSTTTKAFRAKSSLFETAELIAWDGEGIDTGRIIEGAREHAFTLLANSVGDELYRAKGISTSDALKFLTDVGAAHKRAVHVLFAGNYDCNCILRDLSREQLILALPEKNGTRTTITVKCKSGQYRLQWIPRKQLSISRIKLDELGRRVNQIKAGYRQPVIEARIVLWDVFGFFQGSFIAALDKWLPNHAGLAIIKRGKAARGSFDTWTREQLTEYNAAELDALVDLMEAVRNAIRDLGLTITRWDGAGAIAAGMLKQRDMKKCLPEPPKEVERAAAYAYFGGRIERGQFGVANSVHAYDINSAYPATIASLPDLSAGRWRRQSFEHGIPLREALLMTTAFSVFRVQWHYASVHRYFPFPFRIDNGGVFFPNSGQGWYWRPEVESAAAWEHLADMESIGHGGYVYEVWSFVEHDALAPSPWQWVRDYYEQRRAMLLEGRTGGAELMIKLGINSLYGKTAQTAGYNADDGRKPPYHSMCLAGYITSSTRAKLCEGVCLDPAAVIMLATDGIFSKRPLPIKTTDDKTLGAWGVSVYDDFVSVASGVYFARKPGRPWQSISRGYDRVSDDLDIHNRLAGVLHGWRQREPVIYWPSTRFVGGGTAKVSDLQFKRWCAWYESRTEDGTLGRAVQLIPREFKRSFKGDARKLKPAERMEWTEAAPGQGMDIMSTSYFLPWDVIDEREADDEVEDAGHA